MKNRLPANTPTCDSDDKTPAQQATKCPEENRQITYSELLTSEHDNPLSSVLSLPLSKGMTNSSTQSSSIAIPPSTDEQFPPVHYHPHQIYHPDALTKSNQEATELPETINFPNQEQTTRNTCPNSLLDFNPAYLPTDRIFHMKVEPFHDMEEKCKIQARKASELLAKDEKDCVAMGTTKISPFIKIAENNRKRHRTASDGIKTALQRKMEHLDKEKERRLRQTKCYDYLRGLVPCGKLKTDKANILEATVAYLTYIRQTLGTSMDVIDKNFLDEFERNKGSSE